MMDHDPKQIPMLALPPECFEPIPPPAPVGIPCDLWAAVGFWPRQREWKLKAIGTCEGEARLEARRMWDAGYRGVMVLHIDIRRGLVHDARGAVTGDRNP